jgi:hypothetical protein
MTREAVSDASFDKSREVSRRAARGVQPLGDFGIRSPKALRAAHDLLKAVKAVTRSRRVLRWNLARTRGRAFRKGGGGGEEGVGEAWVRREPLGGLAVVSRPC